MLSRVVFQRIAAASDRARTRSSRELQSHVVLRLTQIHSPFADRVNPFLGASNGQPATRSIATSTLFLLSASLQQPVNSDVQL